MATTTTNLSLYKPTVGGDADLWGGYQNTNADLLDSQAATATLNKDYADFQVKRPALTDYSETQQVVSYSATPTFDLSLGNHIKMTLTGNVTSFTVTNPPPSGKVGIIRLKLKQDGTGGRTFAVPASFKPVGGVTPTFDTTANATNVIIAVTDDAGTTYEYYLNAGFSGL